MENSIDKQISWIIQQHRDTNHLYDGIHPYEYHLDMVYLFLIKCLPEIDVPEGLTEDDLKLAAWGHDLIEDTRVSYNDVKKHLGEKAADIIYALTNEKGKTRKERANEKYYKGIRDTPGAVLIKLCDRIANVEYSIKTESRMLDVYRKENPEFMSNLGYPHQSSLLPIFRNLDYLVNNF